MGGGGKGRSDPPPAPDPEATARAQGAANREAAIAGSELAMINQRTPFGDLTYQQIGESSEGNPRYQATVTLTPEQQRILDLENALGLQFGQTAQSQLGAAQGALSTPVDFSGLGPAPEINEATRQATADALYGRINPQLERDRAALDNQLRNQGFVPGTAGYDEAMQNFNQSVTDTRLGVENAALGQAAQLYGLEANQRDRLINEILTQRTQPLNELAALTGQTQVRSPQFVNTPTQGVQPADIMGATYGSANINAQNYASRLASDRARTAGLYGLLGAVGGGLASNYGGTTGWTFSDRRLKRNIRKVGKTAAGLGLYMFRYNWSEQFQLGVMADEVKAKFPDAVAESGGYAIVDYARIG